MNTNFRVSFYLQGRENKDGRTTILYRIYLGQERLPMGSTGFHINKDLWDTSKGRLFGNTKEIRYMNAHLDDMESDLRTIFRRMEFSDNLSLPAIRSEYLKRGKVGEGNTFVAYFDAYIKRRSEEVGHGLTASSIQKYKVTRRRFVEYLQSTYRRKDILFAEMDYKLISGFEHYLKTSNRMVNNTAMRMLKTMKTVVLEASREGLLKKDPYVHIKMHMDPVDRGFLTDRELKRMMEYEFSIKRLEQVRDFFIFSCFTGLAYADLAKLTYKEIVEMNGRMWIIARRQKTHVSCNVPLLDIPLRIIEKYRGHTKDDHVLPIISNQKTNAFLKEIAAVCGIEKNLTCHLARHTFATMSLSKNVSIESVSKMLGHTNIRTTQVYARITNKKVERDMEQMAEQLEGFDDNFANMTKKEKEKEIAPIYNELPADGCNLEVRVDLSIDTPDSAPAAKEKPSKRRGRPRKNVEPAPVKSKPNAVIKETKQAVQPSPTPAPAQPTTLTPYIENGKLVVKTPDGQTFVLSDQVSAAPAQQPTAPPTKKQGRPRKVQTKEAPAVKSTTTAYVDGKFVTTQEPPLEENKKRKRIPHGVKVDTSAGRRARRR